MFSGTLGVRKLFCYGSESIKTTESCEKFSSSSSLMGHIKISSAFDLIDKNFSVLFFCLSTPPPSLATQPLIEALNLRREARDARNLFRVCYFRVLFLHKHHFREGADFFHMCVNSERLCCEIEDEMFARRKSLLELLVNGWRFARLFKFYVTPKKNSFENARRAIVPVK